MGICPQCGSYVDEGEPYCPYCSYYPGDSSGGDDLIEINGFAFDVDEVEEELRERGYDLDDLKSDRIDDDELDEIIWELR